MELSGAASAGSPPPCFVDGPLKVTCEHDLATSDVPPPFTTAQWVHVRDLLYKQSSRFGPEQREHAHEIGKKMNQIQHRYHSDMSVVGLQSRQIAERVVAILLGRRATCKLDDNISALEARGEPVALTKALRTLQVKCNKVVHAKHGTADYATKADVVEATMLTAMHVCTVRLLESDVFGDDSIGSESGDVDLESTFEPELARALEELKVSKTTMSALEENDLTRVDDFDGVSVDDLVDGGLKVIAAKKMLERVIPAARRYCDATAASTTGFPRGATGLRAWFDERGGVVLTGLSRGGDDGVRFARAGSKASPQPRPRLVRLNCRALINIEVLAGSLSGSW
jgi:hypothetical protein